MVTIAVIAGWITTALVGGIGIGRVIARADLDRELSELDRELQALTTR